MPQPKTFVACVSCDDNKRMIHIVGEANDMAEFTAELGMAVKELDVPLNGIEIKEMEHGENMEDDDQADSVEEILHHLLAQACKVLFQDHDQEHPIFGAGCRNKMTYH